MRMQAVLTKAMAAMKDLPPTTTGPLRAAGLVCGGRYDVNQKIEPNTKGQLLMVFEKGFVAGGK
jgi:hypothetical protein